MEQTLELKMQAQAENAINKIKELSQSVISLGESVKKVTSTLTSSAKTTNTTLTSTNVEGNKLYTTIRKIGSDGSLKKTTVSVRELENAATKTRSNFSKLSDTISKIGKGLSLAGLYVGVKNLASKFMDWMDLAVDRIEQLNLFNVVFKNITKDGQEAFSTLGKEAINFQYKLKEAFGTNLTETLQHQALFQSMAENQGIGDTYAKLMSENMTKMVYDLGSLYNRSEEDVAAAIKAGVYAGQTKPLRAFGLDITTTSLEPLLDSLGISDRSIAQMSQAEKQILRYIAVLKQAQVAMGDYANNIESPAIQTKVFKNTLIEAKVALQSLFIQTFAKILPYANAILMVITEVTKAIASFFGIKLQDYNSGIASNLSDIDDGIDNVGDSAGSATGKVKELKRQLLGFDQINNINDPKEPKSGSGSGGGASGGIDQRLLDALYGYDNGMDKIRMKATEIRDKIMEWLGFMKVIDPITGEVSFKFANTRSTIYKLVMAFKDIVKYGKQAIKGVFKVIKKDFDNGSFGNFIVNTFKAIANLLKFIAEHKDAQTLLAKLLETFVAFKVVNGILNPITAKLQELSGSITGVSSIMGGLKIQALGIFAIHDSIKSLSEDGLNLIGVLEGLAGTIGTVGGSILTLTTLLGPIGVPLGVIVGLFETLAAATNSLFSDETVIDRINNVNKSLEEYESTMKGLDEAKQSYLEKGLGEIGYYQDLWKELKLITDENGKIKEGYETRANFIVNELSNALGIEIKVVDGVIQKYSDLEKKVYNVIEAKRAQYLVDANADKYNTAKDKSIQLEKDYADAVKNTHDVVNEANPIFEKLQKEFRLNDEELQNFIDTGVLSLEHISLMSNSMTDLKNKAVAHRETLEKARESEEKAGKIWANNQKIIGDYETALGYLSEENYEAVTKIYTDTINYQGKSQEETKKNYTYAIESQQKYLKELKDNKYKYDEDYLKQ